MNVLLVFEPPASGWNSLQLELPASAWGRKGTCRFRIPELFTAISP
jgi:hypothetical protein